MPRQCNLARVQHPARSRASLIAAGWLAGGILAVALLAMPSAEAAAPCTAEANRSLFELEALKSELMVLATNCQEQDRYNAFVRRYQPELANTERELGRYFKAAYGRKAQHEQDAYVTALANAQSEQAHVIGADFCPRNGALFQEVMALRGASDLPAFAAGQDLVPTDLGACTAAPAPAVKRVHYTRSRRHHRHTQ